MLHMMVSYWLESRQKRLYKIATKENRDKRNVLSGGGTFFMQRNCLQGQRFSGMRRIAICSWRELYVISAGEETE